MDRPRDLTPRQAVQHLRDAGFTVRVETRRSHGAREEVHRLHIEGPGQPPADLVGMVRAQREAVIAFLREERELMDRRAAGIRALLGPAALGDEQW